MIQYIFVSALFAYGMFTIQRPGFLLDWLRPMWKKLPKALHEPLFECGVCTSSIWGGGCFLYLSYLLPLLPPHDRPLGWLPVIIVAASGIQSVMDRAVKAFEKHYGYKPPLKDKSRQWDYLLPYVGLRTMLLQQFVNNAHNAGTMIFEIGGYHKEWDRGKYVSFNETYPFTDASFHKFRDNSYCLVIIGLAYEGNLRHLKAAIAGSRQTFIEYSDDGISRQQVELLSEGIKTRMLVPEFEINVSGAPPQCGQNVNKRKIIVLQP